MRPPSLLRQSVRSFKSGLVILSALICVYAAKPEGETEKAASAMWLDYVSIALVILMLVAFVVWIAVILRRMSDRQREEEREALQFEAQMGRFMTMNEVAADGAGAPSAVERPPRADVAPAVAPAAVADPAPAEPAASPVSAASNALLDSVLTKLRNAGLYAAMEGRLYLSDGETEGLMVRLTNGKTAVVLPRLEPPDFLATQLKRFDLCIVSLGGDQVAVLSPMGQYIADNLSM